MKAKTRSDGRGYGCCAPWLGLVDGGTRSWPLDGRSFSLLGLLLVVASCAQAPTAGVLREFVSIDAPVVALTHVRVIDGTGGPSRSDQTVVIRDGAIVAMSDTTSTSTPPDAHIVDLSGRTVLPGFVMLHEHMFFTADGGPFKEMPFSFPRLYLAGGATTVRTGGSLTGRTELELRRAIDNGETPGPALDVTSRYLNGSTPLRLPFRSGPGEMRRAVARWAGEGVTSVKAYERMTRAELGAAIEEAHRRGLKVTGHLCAVTFSEAADLGIDNLEHGLWVATDFVPGKQPDVCPPQTLVAQSILAVSIDTVAVETLIRKLVNRGVTLTSTLPVFETFLAERAPASDAALQTMAPEAREQYVRHRAQLSAEKTRGWAALFQKEMAFERAFVRAGGLLVAGTDPTGHGGVVAGFSNQRAIELLVEAGFTPLEAIRIATLNGARYLGRDSRVGTLATGKQADLVVVRGDPATNIADIEQVETVFKQGVGYDSRKLIDSVRGTVGIR